MADVIGKTYRRLLLLQQRMSAHNPRRECKDVAPQLFGLTPRYNAIRSTHVKIAQTVLDQRISWPARCGRHTGAAAAARRASRLRTSTVCQTPRHAIHIRRW